MLDFQVYVDIVLRELGFFGVLLYSFSQDQLKSALETFSEKKTQLVDFI